MTYKLIWRPLCHMKMQNMTNLDKMTKDFKALGIFIRLPDDDLSSSDWLMMTWLFFRWFPNWGPEEQTDFFNQLVFLDPMFSNLWRHSENNRQWRHELWHYLSKNFTCVCDKNWIFIWKYPAFYVFYRFDLECKLFGKKSLAVPFNCLFVQ